MKQRFFDWEYIYENGKYDILQDKECANPKSFYKFYALSENSVDALTHTFIYASHPNQLNDLFDCSPYLLDFDTIASLRKTLNGLEEFSKMSDQDLLTEDNKSLARMCFTAQEYKNLGVVSLSSNFKNPLMWSYYANNSGFCVEFDVNKIKELNSSCFKFYGPFPINYQENLHPIKMSEVKDFHLAMLVQCNVKESVWNHEEEWRLMVESYNGINFTMYGMKEVEQFGGYDRKIPYPLEAIKSIKLGVSFFDFGEMVSSEMSVLETREYVFVLKNEKNKKLKRQLLDFVSIHQITVCYMRIVGVDYKLLYIPMKIIKKEDTNDCYVGKIIESEL